MSAGWPERGRPPRLPDREPSLGWGNIGLRRVEPRYRCYAAIDLCIRNLATELSEGVVAGAHKGRIRG